MIVATSTSSTIPLQAVEIPSRKLRDDEVRVRVRAVGVNPVDWKMRTWGPLNIAYRVLGPSGPFVTGVDFAGEVVEVGARATGLGVGARVVGGTNFARGQFGSYASEVCVRPDQCATIPDSVDFDTAGSLPVAAVTAWNAVVELARVPQRPDARVLVFGASGGVGLFAVQIAKMYGAEVVGVCSTRNEALVSRLGAKVIDYTKADAVRAAAELGPFDLVFNTVGTTYRASDCIKLVKPDGKLGVIAVGPSDLPWIVFSPRVHHVFGRPTREKLSAIVAAVAKGDIEVLIAERFTLADAEKAHQLSQSGKVVGKLVINP